MKKGGRACRENGCSGEEVLVFAADDAGRVLLDEGEVVGCHDDGCAGGGDVMEAVDDVPCGFGVKIASGLIEQGGAWDC